MARLLLISLVFAPDAVSTSVIMSELAQELHALGHDVTVLSTTPHYNLDVEARGRQPLHRLWGGLLYRSDFGGIPVYHASMPAKASRVGARLFDYLRFHILSTFAGLVFAGDADIILAPSPPLTIGLSAWLLGMARSAPFIYNVQEIYPDVAVSLGMLRNPIAIRAFSRLERFVYARAARVVVISDGFRHRLLAKDVPAAKLCIIPNFVDVDFMQPGPRHNAFTEAHNLDDKFVALYAGNIGLTQDLETVLAAAQTLSVQPDIHLVIVGDGARRGWLEDQLAAAELPNVTLLPYQPRSVVPLMYAGSDVCLAPLKAGTAGETFPSKIYTIMAAERAVIAAADPGSDLAVAIQQAGCGWAVAPGHAAALSAAILDAYDHRDSLPLLGAKGRAYVQTHHTRLAVAQAYDHLIRSMI